ncbi:LEAF RUST 10 DISEASE-RESISTANCE LOCUS RECEPTOR-LIKE PROTEIN KINASE-like 1.2 [Musa acuminata AAA Group]|uniref:LEAF RUST 10 DISEASE-RESISTANCE LOCUS RECEPTOR-LIKE PROTEIN KINASE-like 1.2 n=1 Tax=Musa acuminata AAA Group TaxID=214697 RepID=UPI0031DF4DAE
MFWLTHISSPSSSSFTRMDLETLLKRDRFAIFVFALLSMLMGKRPASADPPPTMKVCEPKACGNGLNISFPFWLDGEQPTYCGYPPFKVTCKNGSYSPVLELVDHQFYLLNIYYDNQSFRLTATETFDDPCTFPYSNITNDSSIYPLSINSANKYIFFLVNCTSNQLDYQRKSCGQNWAYYGGQYNSTRVDLKGTGCALVIVPVIADLASDNGNYAQLLRSGLLLNWIWPDCTECKRSGGRCGFNETMGRFMCICRDQIHPVICGNPSNGARRKHIIIGISAAIGSLLLLLSLFVFYKNKKKQQFPPSSKSLFRNASSKPYLKDPEMSGTHFQTHLFSYAELQEATDRFDASKELGDGGFCTVYKGKLQDGRTVAVKRLYENNYRRFEQFMNEIEILSRLRHQNLVDLYGCTSRHSQELLLVYEFVSNGTLADHLHGYRASEGILTWPVRLRIAMETADALAYLHAVNPPVIHRDVKTSNILLDCSFHVKVADFGLSRPFSTDVAHISTAPQGTPGYLDPQYHRCYQLTDKSDVYSFGVVLVELISSKHAVDITRDPSEINLSSMAMTRIQNGELEKLVDAGLGCQSDEATRKMITMVAEVAFGCLQADGVMRPTMKEVLEVLRAIEIEGYEVGKKAQQGGENGDTAELPKNTAPLSPDSVMENWYSSSTTSHTK